MVLVRLLKPLSISPSQHLPTMTPPLLVFLSPFPNPLEPQPLPLVWRRPTESRQVSPLLLKYFSVLPLHEFKRCPWTQNVSAASSWSDVQGRNFHSPLRGLHVPCNLWKRKTGWRGRKKFTMEALLEDGSNVFTPKGESRGWVGGGGVSVSWLTPISGRSWQISCRGGAIVFWESR